MGFKHSARFRGGIALAVLLPIAALVGSIALALGYSTPTFSPAPPIALPARPGTELGVFENGTPDSYRTVEQFTTATKRHPNIVLYFSGWFQPFATEIATGAQDGYLRSYAAQVRDFRYPVIISFAHEMNGDWYPWGEGHASPTDFIKAWRHVVTIFRKQGAHNVTWLWAIHSIGTTLSTMHDYWPGRKYVTWVGLDGYYALPTDNFRYVFGTTLRAVRKLTGKPVLISETAVGHAAGNQPAKIANLFAGIRRHHLLGLVWFDRAQHQDV